MLIRLYVGRFRMKTFLSMLAFLGLAPPLVFAMVGVSHAAELVRFESASVPVSEFQQKRAKARGEVLEPHKGDVIQAFIVKPLGNGPHPVIVYLPDCGGLAPEVKSEAFHPDQDGLAENSREVFWTKRLLSWGYAVVLVDSFTTRGINDTCADPKKGTARSADAYGALAYVAKQPWADSQRVGIFGFSTGDHWRIPLNGDSTAYVIGPERFKAAAAFVYSQSCGLKSPMAAPTLVINGVSAPERAEACPRLTAQVSEGGAPTEERVAPSLFKNFELNSAMPDKATFSEWLTSEPQQADMAAAQVRDFFAQYLKP
jgi:dienelactone hydrolase